ncbi:MAG: hypothetical protein DRJ03_15210 [Chloroflexi bacterium]|nr:MAG: hypothetical protein DRJ03_15210 [Chloroflexota bacterium]
MNVVFAIKAVPERRAMVRATEAVLAGVPHLVVWDYEHRGVTWCTCEALRRVMLRYTSEWICILADDFVYCHDFPLVVDDLCARTKMDALLLYSMAKPKGKIVEVYGELQLRRRPSHQLMVVPVYRRKVAKILLSTLMQSLAKGARRDDDGIAADMIAKCGFKSAVVWPNLCDHIGRRSILGNNWLVGGKERRSAWFPGTDWRPSLSEGKPRKAT